MAIKERNPEINGVSKYYYRKLVDGRYERCLNPAYLREEVRQECENRLRIMLKWEARYNR